MTHKDTFSTRLPRSKWGAALGLFITAALTAAPVLSSPSPSPWLYPQIGEAIYLTDSCNLPGVKGVRIFGVLFDPDPIERVLLVELAKSTAFEQVDCTAATPDGKRLYLVDKWGGNLSGTGKLGYLDLETGVVVDTGMLVKDASGAKAEKLVLGAFSKDGVFYVGSQKDSMLYTLDVDTAIVTPVGKILNRYDRELDMDIIPAAPVTLMGADMAFTASGDLYLWTNANEAGAPMGLYQVYLNAPGRVEAEYIGNPQTHFHHFTGLAFRWNGFGDLAGSVFLDDSMHVLKTTPGAPDASYSPCPMKLWNGVEAVDYDYTYGDMASGLLGFFPCVRTIGYWKNHAWEYIPDASPDVDAEVMICGEVIKEPEGQMILQASTSRNLSMLTAQLIAAKLNTSGAAGVAVIEGAEAFLCSALGSDPVDWFEEFDPKTEKQRANYYKDQLDAFNNGETDISQHCD